MEQLKLNFAAPKHKGSSQHVRSSAVRIRPGPSEAMLTIREVSAATGLSRSTIYERIRAGTFPRQVRVGGLTVGWPESSVRGWIEGRVKRPLEPAKKR